METIKQAIKVLFNLDKKKLSKSLIRNVFIISVNDIF